MRKILSIIFFALALITLNGIFTAISNEKGIATILGALVFIAIFAYAGVTFWKEPKLNKETKEGFGLHHTKGLRSCAGIIDHSENEISWSGLAAVIHNGGVEDVYLFADCLKKVGALHKYEAIKKLTLILDNKMGGPPPPGKDVNGYAVADTFEEWIKKAEKEYNDSSEDAIGLAKRYSLNTPSERSSLKSDAGMSELAKELLSEISPDDTLTGEPEIISIDLSRYTDISDCGALIKSLEPKLGALVSGKGELKNLEDKFEYVKKKWGTPIQIEFSNGTKLKEENLSVYMELYQWFPRLYSSINGVSVIFKDD